MRLPDYIKDFEQWKSEFSFHIPIKIRFSETDMFGHVNNVSPFIYFEEARIEFLYKINLFGQLNDDVQLAPVVADLQCDYLKQIFFGDQLKLYVKAHHIGSSSIDLHYMAINQRNEVVLTGRGTIVQINVKTGRPTPFNEEQLNKLRNV
mgnify:FL=1